MNIWEKLCRLSRLWLLTPVALLCCTSPAHGGLAIGLADAEAEELLCEAADSCLADPCDDRESRIESRSGQMACSSSFNRDNIEQFGDTIALLTFAPLGARAKPQLLRVTSKHVNPPPLIVPIDPS